MITATWTCHCGRNNGDTQSHCGKCGEIRRISGGSELQLFDVGDRPWRFGVADDGRPYAVAADVAKAFDHRDAANTLRILDEDEKGTQIVSTPGGDQRLSVVYEDGIWELIFRSTKPEAKDVKKRVKEILRTIRETGGYGAPRQMTRLELIETAREAEIGRLAELEARHAAERRAAELEPAAQAWGTLVDGSGDYSVREAAQILDRDPAISTGQNRLSRYLRDIAWCDATGQPYQHHVNAGRLRRRAVTYPHPHTGEQQATSQVRITAKGLEELRRHLGGGGQLALIPGGA